LEILIILAVVLQVITLLAVTTDSLQRLRPKRVLIDTSALIDRRILELAKTGFIPGQLVVPKYVLAEMQMLADGTNNLKRQRARQGMEAVQELQDSRRVNVHVPSWSGGTSNEVDDKLIHDAKRIKAAIFTVDFNLQKVAEIESIEVLNVNSLSQTLRPIVLPGEEVQIKIAQKGADRGQGVGYLDDGTMVVVDKASRLIGKSVKVKVTRNLQTQAGRMMFAEKI